MRDGKVDLRNRAAGKRTIREAGECDKKDGGVLIDVDVGMNISAGLSMPIPLAVQTESCILLHSGPAVRFVIDPANGQIRESSSSFPDSRAGFHLRTLASSACPRSARRRCSVAWRFAERDFGQRICWRLGHQPRNRAKIRAFVQFRGCGARDFAVEVLPVPRIRKLGNEIASCSPGFTNARSVLAEVPPELRRLVVHGAINLDPYPWLPPVARTAFFARKRIV